jgi:type III pantothenate kinase
LAVNVASSEPSLPPLSGGREVILAIDAGNTRLKWGTHNGTQWTAGGAVMKDQVVRLQDAWKLQPAPAKIVIANVAGELIRSQLTVLLARWRVPPHWVTSAKSQCGVVSHYEDPKLLGCDRWAALIGAHHLHSGAALVVMAGTAMTVDALTGDGRFVGGLIVPGLNLMVESLTSKTAGIRVERGKVQTFPSNTGDAVWSGALNASAGAIERMLQALEAAGEPGATVLLSGGAAGEIEALIHGPVRRVDNLVLEGLVRIAAS